MSARLGYTLRALARNLGAGLRLALFLPVGRASFRIFAAGGRTVAEVALPLGAAQERV